MRVVICCSVVSEVGLARFGVGGLGDGSQGGEQKCYYNLGIIEKVVAN